MSFLSIFHKVMLYAAILSFVLAIVMLFYFYIKCASIRNYKEKFDFINEKEILWLRKVFIVVGIGVVFLINRYGSDDSSLQTTGMWFYVRMFFSLAGGTLVAYVTGLVLKFYYPTTINRKLKKWRYMPRKNPSTGNVMRLLTEEEEDVHLNPEMQAEEAVLSVDYDVWIDDQTEEVIVEKYHSHRIALKCNGCGYYTMQVIEEEVSQKYEDGSPKELIKHYKCSYCKCVRATAFNISNKKPDEFDKNKSKVRNSKSVLSVRIDINTAHLGRKVFVFDTVEETSKFLDDLDLDKL